MKTKTSLEEDKALLALVKEGRMKAFNALFRKYYQPLCAYAHRYVVREDLEEIVQDLFLWLWKHREEVEIHTSLHVYLFRAVHTRCLNRIERNAAKRRVETSYWEKYAGHCSIEDYQTDELITRIHEAIRKLPESYRQAFVQHRFNDKSYKEIAQELNVSAKTVDYRIQKALKLLREDLKEYLPTVTALLLPFAYVF